MQETSHSYSIDTTHPLISAVYFCAVFVFTMAAFQPVLVALAFAGSILSNCAAQGVRKALASFRWQLPLLLVVAILNPLLSPIGTTQLLRVGTFALYLESIVYGLCMGCMLIAIMQWCACAACVISTDKLLLLTGRYIPTIGLMISMIGRLVPHFVSRGQGISDVAKMNTASKVNDNSVKKGMRQISVLMGWTLEDSLETADAMRSRGWGSGARRTTYSRYRFRPSDAVLLVLLCLFIALCAVLAIAACGQFTFYPQMPQLIVWWGYFPYAVFMLIPVFWKGVVVLRWKTCQ